jgi:hypothetical protein
MKTIAAGTFKASCLAIVDDVKARRELASWSRSWCLPPAMSTILWLLFKQANDRR